MLANWLRDVEGWALKGVSCSFISPPLPPPLACGNGTCDIGFGSSSEDCNNCPGDCVVVAPAVCPPLPPPPPPQSTGILRGDGIDNVLITSGGTTTCTFENSGQGTLKIVSQAIGGDKYQIFNYTIKKYDPGLPTATTNPLLVTTNRLIRYDGVRGDEWTGDNKIDVDKGITAYTITQEISDVTLLPSLIDCANGFCSSGTSCAACLTDVANCVPCNYSSSHGWTLNSVECEVQYKDSSAPTGVRTIYSYGVNSVTVRGGRTTTCTFRNTKKGELKIIKEAIGETTGVTTGVTTERFDFDVNFVSSGYFPSGILPFALKPDECGDGTCGLDEDCYICKTDCGSCSFPPPRRPGPGYSPSRMTINASASLLPLLPPPPNNETIKRIYPGIYRVTELISKTRPDGNSWLLDNVSCEVEYSDCIIPPPSPPTTPPTPPTGCVTGPAIKRTTGEKIGMGVGDLDIFAGKTTTCTFKNALRAPQGSGDGGGGGGGGSEQELRQDQ